MVHWQHGISGKGGRDQGKGAWGRWEHRETEKSGYEQILNTLASR